MIRKKLTRIMCSSVFVLIALACISASTLAFNVQLSPRLGIPLSRKATAVSKGNNLASTGVSLMKLGAGLQREEEEEYFESDVGIIGRDSLVLKAGVESIATL